MKITDDEGKEWYYVTLVDITKRVEMQEQLRMSEEISRLAIEHSGSIVALFDVQARTLTFSTSVSPIYEVPNVLEGMPAEQIALGRVSPDTADVYMGLFESIVGSVYDRLFRRRQAGLGCVHLCGRHREARARGRVSEMDAVADLPV